MKYETRRTQNEKYTLALSYSLSLSLSLSVIEQKELY